MINGKDQEIITINKTGNSILNNAKYSADNTDEWYTTYETIAEELSHYAGSNVLHFHISDNRIDIVGNQGCLTVIHRHAPFFLPIRGNKIIQKIWNFLIIRRKECTIVLLVFNLRFPFQRFFMGMPGFPFLFCLKKTSFDDNERYVTLSTCTSESTNGRHLLIGRILENNADEKGEPQYEEK